MKHSPQLARLIDALRALPGVGPKTAQRMAFHLLQEGRAGRARAGGSAEQRRSTAWGAAALPHAHGRRAVPDLRRASARCVAVCVVESPADVVAVEQSGSFRGHYFVLMGHLSPLDGIGPEQLGVRELEGILDEGRCAS